MHNYTENQKINFTIFSYYHSSILTSQLKKKIATTITYNIYNKKKSTVRVMINCASNILSFHITQFLCNYMLQTHTVFVNNITNPHSHLRVTYYLHSFLVEGNNNNLCVADTPTWPCTISLLKETRIISCVQV